MALDALGVSSGHGLMEEDAVAVAEACEIAVLLFGTSWDKEESTQ